SADHPVGSGAAGIAGKTEYAQILRAIAGNFFPWLAGDLLWRRFSPFRCTSMPLRLMEKLKRRQYRGRSSALAAGGFNFSLLLSCLGLPLEVILLGGEFVFLATFLQIMMPEYRIYNELDTPVVFNIFYGLYCINYILVESLYVCMGFGIYINSRVEVEGWDIELLFRKFCRKFAGAAKIFLVVFCLLAVVPLQPLQAEESFAGGDRVELNPKPAPPIIILFPPGFVPPESVPSKDLDEVLLSPDFGGKEPSWRIVPKDREIQTAQQAADYPPWLKQLREILAQSLRVFIIIIIAASVIFLLVRLYLFRRGRKKTTGNKGADFNSNPIAARGDPDYLFNQAELFFNRGDIRKAWACCLSGVLSAFDLYLNITVPSYATEYGCLQLVQSRCGKISSDNLPVPAAQLTGGFSELINNWILLAYGAKEPASPGFENALAFGRSLQLDGGLLFEHGSGQASPETPAARTARAQETPIAQ
ncbi:MAG: hypothetical protein FWD78_14040, partial [Treponema sp.]|nr:hypothetical protein [Treponema sp.]